MFGGLGVHIKMARVGPHTRTWPAGSPPPTGSPHGMCGVTEGLAAPAPPYRPIDHARHGPRKRVLRALSAPRGRPPTAPSYKPGNPPVSFFARPLRRRIRWGTPTRSLLTVRGGAPEGGPLMPLFVWVPSLFMARNCFLRLPSAYPSKVRG